METEQRRRGEAPFTPRRTGHGDVAHIEAPARHSTSQQADRIKAWCPRRSHDGGTAMRSLRHAHEGIAERDPPDRGRVQDAGLQHERHTHG